MSNMTSEISQKSRFVAQIRKGPWIIYTILILFVLFNIIFNPYFWNTFNLSNIIAQSTALMVVSVGQSFVIVGGGFDFSVGGIVSLTTCILATQMQNALISIFLVVLLGLFAGTSVGVANGIGVALFRINPFIMTLGSMTIAKGISYVLREYPGGYIAPGYIKGLTGNLGFIPTPVLFMAGAVVMGVILFRKTRFGRYTYAIGGSEESARSAGINVNVIKIVTFAVSGFFATVAGLFMAARIASGDPRIGESFPLDSITAVVLGGIIIGGGRGSLIGVVAGVFLIVVLNNALTLFDVSPYYQYIIKGVLMGLAVAITFRKEKREYT